ncbi:hypothetical protein [Streptomyces sp. G1]|uniref:hypothetical protein n=1 Tax=Streptomyces sp. G1 TaxID=361572 RepID=UPI00202F706B|nr:hypothetical protein [Streptomyces sp. G1]MCM1972311.1 hypothetical protein [Streptomyces sp. G1]
MTFDLNSLLGPVVSLLGVPLGAWLHARTTARAEAKAERDSFRTQANSMVVAVAELRAAVDEDHILWSNWKEKVRAGLLAAMTAAGFAAFTHGSDRRQLAAALGGAAWQLSQERNQQKTAASNITPKITAVVQAAAPLLQHADTRVCESTERVMTAVYGYPGTRNPAELEEALHAFGLAVRAAAEPTPNRWRRPLLRGTSGR